MHLGTLLARLQDTGDAAMALGALGDIVLYTEVQATGEQFDETPGAYTAGAVSRFAAAASDEQWLGLMAAMERSENPARAALAHMLAWALRQDAASPDDSDNADRSCNCGAEVYHRP
jgi:hypothetical protein